VPKLTFGDYWLELPTRFSKGQLTYLLYGKELSSSGSYLKLWVKKRLKISFDGKKKLENFLTSSMRTPKPIIKQWCDPLMTFHKHCSCYSLLTLR
jgi:hypothetical protein